MAEEAGKSAVSVLEALVGRLRARLPGWARPGQAGLCPTAAAMGVKAAYVLAGFGEPQVCWARARSRYMMPAAICSSVSAAGLSHHTWISEPGFFEGR